MESSSHTVVLISGGLDSTALAYMLSAHGGALTLVSVDYGQLHARELAAAAAISALLGAPHELVDLRPLGALMRGSALTDRGVNVPDGHYTDATMRATVVPNRNALLLDVAVAIAVARGADAVAFGAHAGDRAVYPDCRPAFVTAFTEMVRVANEGFLSPDFQVLAPFIALSKAEIVMRAAPLGVPFAATWSCYRDGDSHCGRCGTCIERREAFVLAQVDDPTRYESTEPIPAPAPAD